MNEEEKQILKDLIDDEINYTKEILFRKNGHQVTETKRIFFKNRVNVLQSLRTKLLGALE